MLVNIAVKMLDLEFRVIIAEDNKFMRNECVELIKNIFINYFRKNGLEIEEDLIYIEEVEEGRSLIDSVKKNEYHFILTDYDLLDKTNGLDAIIEIKEYERKQSRDTPIVLMSGYDEESDLVRKAKKAGIKAYIEKATIDFEEELTRILEEVVGDYYELR